MPLVLVDGTRIRQEIKEEYDRALKELDRARRELNHFHQHDLPSFTRWVSQQFGPLLTELRETSRRMQELHLLLLDIEQEVMFRGISHWRAYQKVMRERQNSENAGDADPEPDGSEHSSSFHEEDPGFSSAWENAQGTKPSNSEDRRSPAAARLKELYRAVVRRLHPDTQKEMTAQKLEWWHQAQAAYQNGDIEQMEVILTLCEIDEAGTTEKSNLSVLQRIIGQFRNALREVQHQISACRRDPAWKFSQRKRLESLRQDLENKLERDLGMMKQELHEMEMMLETWSTQAEFFRTARGTPRRRRNPIQFF